MKKVNAILKRCFIKFHFIRLRRHNKKTFPTDSLTCDLTKEEKQKIDAVWSRLKPINYDYFRYYKQRVGFSEEYVPKDIYFAKMLPVLNPASLRDPYRTKAISDTVYRGLKQPRIILRSIFGVWYDSNMEIVNREDGVKMLDKQDFIIKPSIHYSGGGRSVRVVRKGENIEEILSTYGDFIAQELLKQSPKTAQFNTTSLNTFRVSTLNLNGRITAQSIMFRHGVEGSVIDNASAGGLHVAVTPQGKFYDYAITHEAKPIYEHNGVKYADIQIDEVQKIVELAIESHRKYIPMLGFCGWDFALDENNEPVFIEANIYMPDFVGQQMSMKRGIFGDRLEEVIDYVEKRLPNLKFYYFVEA